MKRIGILLAILCCGWSSAAENDNLYFDWQKQLPLAVDGFNLDDVIGSAVCGDTMVLVTGSKICRFDLTAESNVIAVSDAPHPLESAIICSVGDDLMFIGVNNTDSIILKNLDESDFAIEKTSPLPYAVQHAGAVAIGKTVYLVGGFSVSDSGDKKPSGFYRIDLSQENPQWEKLEDVPGGLRISPAVSYQNHGTGNYIYVFGSKGRNDGYKYSVTKKNWQQIENLPENYNPVGSIFPLGQSHIMLFELGGKDSVLAYHTISDSWTRMNTGQHKKIICADVYDSSVVIVQKTADQKALISKAKAAKSKSFGILDYIIIGGYLIGLAWMGVYFSKRENSTEDFFFAGRRVPWWAASLSLIGTGLSAITFMTWPAKSYMSNWVFFMQCVMTVVAAPILIFFYLPFFRRLNVTTAYEYLEYRFNLPVRLLSSFLFMFMQVGRIGFVLFIPSIALATVTGFNVYWCILIMSILCCFYTVLGGMEAVIWTDVTQVIILLGSAILCLFIIVFTVDGGIAEIVSLGMAADKFEMANMSWDWTMPALWVVLVGQFFFIFAIPTDQSLIQRLLVTKDEKQAARSIIGWAAMAIPTGIIFYGLGSALYAFYKTHPESLNPFLQNDAILPWFVSSQMPKGIIGLVISALFAATMSSVDSSMNSVSAAVVNDFYCRFKKNASQKNTLTLARVVTLLVGLIGTAVAILMAAYGSRIKSLLELYWEINVLIIGAVAGIFVSAVFSKRTNGVGILCGAAAGAATLFFAKTQTEIHFLLYAAIGVLSTCLFGWLVSLVVPDNKPIDGFTVHSIFKRKGN